MANLVNIGMTGLNAAMAGLSTAGHNISNASTPGYTRQQIVQSPSTALFTTGGFLGQGTQVSQVQRVYSQFLSSQVASAQSREAELSAYSTQINQVDNLLADAAAGLTPALQDFFTAVQGMATNPGSNPSSAPSRQTLISSAETLVARFQSMDQTLATSRDNVNSQINNAVTVVSDLTQQIAAINVKITETEASSAGQPANDLRDQRDQLLNQLGQQIGITTTDNADGSLNVFIGNGVPLVSGTQAFSMFAAVSQTDPSQVSIGVQTVNQTKFMLPDSQVTGGALGGLISFVNNTLNPVENQFGQVAIALAESFNNQHELGQDLNGNIGQAFFNLGQGTVNAALTNSGNSQNGVLTVGYDATNIGGLTSSDYRVTYDGRSFNVTRLSDHADIASFDFATPSVSIDGLTFNFDSSKGIPAAGDSFLVQPTRRAASSITVAITDANMVAAASATRTSTNISNIGTAAISAGTLTSADNLSSLFPAASASPSQVTLTYDGAGNLNISDLPATAAIQVTHNGVATVYAPGTSSIAFSSGDTIALATDFTTNPAGDYSFTITGQPAAGDRFYLSLNTDATSDNGNALALGQLQTSNIMNNGKATYEGVYAQMVGVVGNTAKDTTVNLTAQQALVTQFKTNQQSLSGVNLDEEAANLIRYQQAYQAAGKLIQVSSTLFNQLLNM